MAGVDLQPQNRRPIGVPDGVLDGPAPLRKFDRIDPGFRD
jgi:hypothetical protein